MARLPGKRASRKPLTNLVVRQGETSEKVNQLRAALIERGYDVEETGRYDDKLKSQVRAFQKAEGLLVDGKVGNETWTAVVGAPKPRARPQEAPPPRPKPEADARERPGFSEYGQHKVLMGADTAIEALLDAAPREIASWFNGLPNEFKEDFSRVRERAEKRFRDYEKENPNAVGIAESMSALVLGTVGVRAQKPTGTLTQRLGALHPNPMSSIDRAVATLQAEVAAAKSAGGGPMAGASKLPRVSGDALAKIDAAVAEAKAAAGGPGAPMTRLPTTTQTAAERQIGRAASEARLAVSDEAATAAQSQIARTAAEARAIARAEAASEAKVAALLADNAPREKITQAMREGWAKEFDGLVAAGVKPGNVTVDMLKKNRRGVPAVAIAAGGAAVAAVIAEQSQGFIEGVARQASKSLSEFVKKAPPEIIDSPAMGQVVNGMRTFGRQLDEAWTWFQKNVDPEAIYRRAPTDAEPRATPQPAPPDPEVVAAVQAAEKARADRVELERKIAERIQEHQAKVGVDIGAGPDLSPEALANVDPEIAKLLKEADELKRYTETLTQQIDPEVLARAQRFKQSAKGGPGAPMVVRPKPVAPSQIIEQAVRRARPERDMAAELDQRMRLSATNPRGPNRYLARERQWGRMFDEDRMAQARKPSAYVGAGIKLPEPSQADQLARARMAADASETWSRFRNYLMEDDPWTRRQAAISANEGRSALASVPDDRLAQEGNSPLASGIDEYGAQPSRFDGEAPRGSPELDRALADRAEARRRYYPLDRVLPAAATAVGAGAVTGTGVGVPPAEAAPASPMWVVGPDGVPRPIMPAPLPGVPSSQDLERAFDPPGYRPPREPEKDGKKKPSRVPIY